MTLKEILAEKGNLHTKIEYRIYYELPEITDESSLVKDITYYNGKYWQDTLFGECEYDPKENKLIPLDRDSYSSLNTKILEYKWTAPDELTVWEDPSEQIQNWDDYIAGFDFGLNKNNDQLRKARKKAKRFKRKYLQLREEYMKLINKSKLEPDAGEIDFDTGYTAYSKTQIDNCPAVDFDAMIEEVREIRDAWSDEADCRTISGVNQTITDCVRILQKYKQKLL